MEVSAQSVLEAPSASAVEASAREMAMEVEWREEKTRVMSPAVEAAIWASVQFVAKIETSAMIARVCLRTSRTGMESELGRE